MANYCTNSQVGVLLNKNFDSTTTPTSTQVDDIIDQVTREIDVTMSSIGISSQPTDSNVLGMLERYCSFGSAGITGMTFFRNANDVNGSNAQWYYDQYRNFLKELADNPELLGISLGTDSLYV